MMCYLLMKALIPRCSDCVLLRFQGDCFHRFSLKVSSRGDRTMTEALFLTFQSQLSVVMETVLKSAMFEITRLVEDSFLEEVGHHKQEVEVLKLRLQLSESKLREKEREREWEKERERGRRTQCPDCGRTGDSSGREESQTVETVHGKLQLIKLMYHTTGHCVGLGELKNIPSSRA